jgi:hypothetical protein
MNDLWISLSPFIVFFAWLFIFGMERAKTCPECHKPLPLLQSPFTKTKRQWLEGGYVCPNCGSESDRSGTKIPVGTPLNRRSFFVGIGLLMLGIVPAIVLLTILFKP